MDIAIELKYAGFNRRDLKGLTILKILRKIGMQP